MRGHSWKNMYLVQQHLQILVGTSLTTEHPRETDMEKLLAPNLIR